MLVFSSKVAAWLLAVLLLLIVVSLVGSMIIYRQGKLLRLVAIPVLLIVGAVLPAWMLLSTKYTVDNAQLHIVSGPFETTVAIATITALQNTNDSRSAPALSLDRIRINYGNGQLVQVSPKDRAEFARAIGFIAQSDSEHYLRAGQP